MEACVLDRVVSGEVKSRREQHLAPVDPRQACTPGVYVPASGLTAVRELARLLGLGEADVDESE